MGATRSGASVSVEDIEMVYGEGRRKVHALNRISLEVAPSEFVSVIGPSGCGKTTLLMIIAGLRSAIAGRVAVDGKPVVEPLTDIGIVFQSPALLDWRTTLGNILLQSEARRMDPKSARQRATELLYLVGLEGFEQRRPYELSGGMQQRAALCRAILHEPALLLMDEPFGAIDAMTRTQLGIDLQRILTTSPATVLFVTHSIPEAVFLSDRVIVMTGRPASVIADVRIDMPRPRQSRALSGGQLQRYVTELEDILRGAGVLHE